MKKRDLPVYLNKQAKIFLLLLVIVLRLTTEAQQRQHLSKYFEGIPVINNTYMGFWGGPNQYHYDSMKTMGVNLFWNGLDVNELNFLKSKDIKAIPINTRDVNNITYQWVQYYCDAKYTVWEAEGTNDPEDAGLYRDTEKTEIITSQGKTFVKTLPFAQSGKMIYGPYYLQENKYVVEIFPNDKRPVKYTADFELMLQKNNQYPHSDTTVYQMTEPICSLQVTTSKIVYRDNNWVVDSVFIIKDTLLTREAFSSLNTFIKFPLGYTLANVPKEFTTTKYRNNTEGVMWSGQSTMNIEFKVIWLGNPKYQLSVDKITVYDGRGIEIKTDSLGVARKIEFEEIGTIRNSPAYDSTVLGWHGIDEVVSIDNFEPIRIVAGILKQQNLRLYLPMMGAPIGVWDNSHSDTVTIGTNQLNRWKVLKKRTQSDNLHIWQNAYFLSPLCPNYMILNWPDKLMSLNEKLIAMTALQYENAKEFDSLFGVSVLTSAQHDPAAYFEDPTPFKILYNVNLALMFGAKFIDLYKYFPGDSCFNENLITCPIDTTLKSESPYTGLVDVEYCTSQWYFTNKWFMWRDILKPRLSGLMGKTLKNLTPLSKLTGKFLKPITMNTKYGYIQQIVNTNSCTAQTTDGSNDAFDLGFFNDSSDKDYFMLISRYYNSDCNPSLKIYFDPYYFQPYRNLTLKNFISGVSLTKLVNQFLSVAMDKGDAVFYGVWPVVKYGGTLIANDTIKSNTTLSNDMWINNNVNLIINRGKYYTIQDTVTLVGTGFITGAGYLNIAQGGEIKIVSWSKSVFKGREGNHPKIYWGKFPNGQNVISYRIYRRKGETNFVLAGTVSSNSPRYFIDNTITILDRPEPFATFAEYKVTAIYQNGDPITESDYSNTIRYDEVDGIAIDKSASGYTATVTEYKLEQNYPNPFNPTTRIKYSIKERQLVQLKIFDVLGRELFTLEDNYKEPGYYETEFDASLLSSGVYIYRLSAGDFVDVKKMVVVK